MLYTFAGLPGAGKTTLARQLARALRAVHLRIDSIEQALNEATGRPVGPEGYLVAYRLAADNLRLGLPVVADSVNPLQITREAWRDVAARARVACVEIEVICSDPVVHRARVESRDSPGHGSTVLTWDDVRQRAYDGWDAPPVVIDTAGQTPLQSFAALQQALDAHPAKRHGEPSGHTRGPAGAG